MGEIITINQTPVNRHPALVYLASLPSPSSRRTMKTALENIAQIFNTSMLDMSWHQLRHEHVNAIRAKLIELYAISTVNRHLSALRGVLKECWRLEMMDAETYYRAIDIEDVKGETLLAGREILESEMKALLETCIQSKMKPIDVRDAAILSVLYTCGLRRDELVSARLEDYSHDSNLLRVVFAKGRMPREAPVVNRTHRRMKEWLDLRGSAPGALFNPLDKHGHIIICRMTDQAIYNMLRRRAKRAGIQEVFTPHDFRRTLIGNLLNAGVDIATVARIVGHKNVKTTERYDRRGFEMRIEASKKVDTPI